ncbi:MAG: hypothetical protein KDK90_07520 [Leptospiraceae bacterium]|nr:hypothetical protein [Leptospiraceae bacterium]
MTIQEMEVKKAKLISMITLLYDDKLILELEKVLQSSQIDWWNIIDEKEKKAIQRGMLDYEQGKLVDNEDVLKGAKKIIQG